MQDWLLEHTICHRLVIHCTCRSADIPDKYKGKKDFSEVTIIVPGPREPKNLDIYMEPLLEDLKAYGPDGAVPALPLIPDSL